MSIIGNKVNPREHVNTMEAWGGMAPQTFLKY